MLCIYTHTLYVKKQWWDLSISSPLPSIPAISFIGMPFPHIANNLFRQGNYSACEIFSFYFFFFKIKSILCFNVYSLPKARIKTKILIMAPYNPQMVLLHPSSFPTLFFAPFTHLTMTLERHSQSTGHFLCLYFINTSYFKISIHSQEVVVYAFK